MAQYKEKPLEPSQLMLYGRSVDDAVPADCDVRGFADVMRCLDYSGIASKRCDVGCPPYPPDVMVKILGYAYAKGVRSSRKIESHLNYDVRFMWLAGGLKPDHNTIARFRKENHKELKELFVGSARLCCEAGLVYLSVVSVDGSKMRASASRKQIYNQARVDREMAAVEKILQEAEEIDRAEDEQDAKPIDNKLPDDLVDAKARKAKLEGIAKQLSEGPGEYAVASEPESRVMKTTDGKRPAYNLQACVDAQNQVIVAMELTQAENDYGQMPGMASAVEATTGMIPDVLLADAGYPDEGTLLWAEGYKSDVLMPVGQHWREAERDDLFASSCFELDEERDILICPAGQELTFRGEYWTGHGFYRRYECCNCKSCSFRSMCVNNGRGNRRISISRVEPLRRKMRQKLKSEEGKRLYKLRSQTVEPVFGQGKSNRGLSRFLAHGFDGAEAESSLMCMCHNVLKLMNSTAAMAYIASASAHTIAAKLAAVIAYSIACCWAAIMTRRNRSIHALQATF